MAGFHVEHFGCRAARADGEAISGRLRAAGQSSDSVSEAAVVIVNTCSVTAEADRQARTFIRRAHRLNPTARIVVTGCYAQRAPEELAGMAGVAAVIGNSLKAHVPEIVLNLARPGVGRVPPAPGPMVSVQSLLAGAAPVWVDDRFEHSFIEEALIAPGAQTRPNLKVQDGCRNRCTFCVIPLTRGPSRSLPTSAVLHQIEDFVTRGGNELVLSGINLGRWGSDLTPRTSFAGLVRQILEWTGLPRLRLSSIEPMDWDDELIGLMAEFGSGNAGWTGAGPSSRRGRLARHAHLPLQSGSDAVLRRMHRRYRPWHYRDKVDALLRAVGPELTIGADVMVGFPGETEAEFEETLTFVQTLPFGYLHLFPFSPRPGTPGWALEAQSPVPRAVVEERMAALRALAGEKTKTHRLGFVGRKLDAITLQTPESLAACGHTSALTDNFLPVEIEGQLKANQLVRIEVTEFNQEMRLKAVPIGDLRTNPRPASDLAIAH
jgi:threonylcarbamoyladenosine tRNA methylthiotransferase MtaB